MEQSINKNSFKSLIRQYTLWFCVFAFFTVIIFFLIDKKSMYTLTDGVSQQFAYFVYAGKWIRTLFGNIFVRHVLELPMWDMSIGTGNDSLIVFSSVANPLADPMYWISVFIPHRIAEYVFDGIIIFKLYVAGLAFACLCHCRKLPVRSTVVAAMVYTFSTVMYTGFTQASFINIFYIFPLLMIGIDRMWTGKGFKLYVTALAFCLINSYYFTYMAGILVASYCVIRFLFEKQNRNFKFLCKILIKFAAFTALGLGIGIGFQLPAIMNLSGLDRLGAKWDVVIFSLDTFKAFFVNAFSMTFIGHEGPWGVCPLAFFALVSLWERRKENPVPKALFIVYTAAIMLPVVGSMFNGFTFPTGRYLFGYILLLAYIVAAEFESILSFTRKKMYILLGVSALYLVICLLTDLNGFLSGVSLLVIGGALLFAGSAKKDVSKFLLLMAASLVSCAIMGFTYLHVYTMVTEADLGTTYDYLFMSNGLDQLSDEERAELNHTRYDFVPFVIDDVPLNSSMLLDAYGYDFYNSNYNNGVDRYYIDMAINSNPLGFMMNGLRGRNYLELMNGTGMISIENKNDGVLRAPYSYELLKSNGDYSIYRASSGSSMVYFYDEEISSDYLQNMNPIEAEELMMNYCVTDGGSSVPSNAPQHTIEDYEISYSEGITMTGDNTFHAETGDYIILTFDDVTESEISVYIEGITNEFYYVVSTSLGNGDDYFVFDTIEGQGNRNNMYYHWRDAFVVNFGYVEEPVNSVRLAFLEGEYTIDDISIFARNTEQLDATVGAFYDHADMYDVIYEIKGNHVYISANTDEDKYLYFAIPYSDGWHATVDGEAVEIDRANIGFMVIPVTSGHHDVELYYRTPYLKEGMMITLVSLCAFIAVIRWNKNKSQDRSS